MSAAPFLLDSNVFIEAHRRYYNARICPGFWKALRHFLGTPSVLSIDKVRDELVEGKDDLSKWITRSLAPASFVSSGQAAVLNRYAEIQKWAVAQNRFTAAALRDFADAEKADAWLIAYALENGSTLVTHEGNDPKLNKRVLIPVVCRAFGIPVKDTFDMLHELKVLFDWNP